MNIIARNLCSITQLEYFNVLHFFSAITNYTTSTWKYNSFFLNFS